MVLERQYGSLFTRHTASCCQVVSALCCGEQETHSRKTGHLSGVIKGGGDSSSFLLVEYSVMSFRGKILFLYNNVLFQEFFLLSVRRSHWTN